MTREHKRGRAAALLWLVPGAGLFLAACSKSADEAGPGGRPSGPVEVTVFEAETRRFFDEVVAVGTLQAEESIEVSSNVTERVEELLFEDNQRVEKGDTLALLASSQEEAMRRSAMAVQDEETREVERLMPLIAKGSVAAADLAARRTRLAVAEAKVAEMEAEIADRRIVAPFSGTVGLRRISPGALVEPGTVITTLDKTDTMKLDFTVPETFVGTLRPGLEVAAESNAFPDRDFDGKVAEVDSRVDPVTRAVAVRALLPNPDGDLKPGMLMTVALERDPRESVVVPERAIMPVGDSRAVFTVVDGVARRTLVVTGRRVPGFIEVREGLEVGDLVVTDGVLGIRDGSEVDVAGRFEGPVAPFDPKSGQSS